MSSEQQSLTELDENASEEVREKYDEVPLSQVIEPVLGKTPRRKEDKNWGGNIMWASAKDISNTETRHIYDTSEYMTEEGKESSNAKQMPEGTVVVTARGTLGEVVQLGKPMTFNQSCYGLKASEEIFEDFLYYAWEYKFNQIQAVSHGTVFDTITMASFDDIEVPLPKKSKQKRIADILGKLDDKIETNNRITELLEEMAQTLFKSWFIDFEPYEEFKDSELGEIPEDFEAKNLVDIADVTYGYSFSSDKFNEDGEGMPVIRIRNIPDDEAGKYSPEEFDEKYLVKAGDVLAGMDGEFRPHIWKGPEAGLNQRVCRFEGKKEIYSEIYLWNAVRKPLYKLEQSKTGTTVIHLGKRDIDDIKLPVPDEDSLKEFNNILRPVYEEMINRQKENRRLEEMRDTLVPKLMSGEIRVND